MKKKSIFEWFLDGLLQWLAEDAVRLSIIEHYRVRFSTLRREKSFLVAFLDNVFFLAPTILALVIENLSWRKIMLSNYIKIFFRNLRRHKIDSAIKISGLSIGISGSILIMLAIADELSFDKHHKNYENIYSVFQWGTFGSYEGLDDGAAPAMAPALKDEYPEILEAVRVWRWNKPLIRYGGNHFYEDRFHFADKEFFEVFNFSFKYGNPEIAVSEPYSVVITENIAKKYFGDTDPMGKYINLWDSPSANVVVNRAFNGAKVALKITGVVNNPTHNSNVQFDFLASYATFGDTYANSWQSSGPATYLLLRPDATGTELEAKLPDFMQKHVIDRFENANTTVKLLLVPIAEVRNFATNGMLTLMLYLAGALAVVILLIGCINFINLSTARVIHRVKEIGVRKVIGAKRKQLIGQILSEATLTAITALPVAVLIVSLILPALNDVLEKTMNLQMLISPGMIVWLFATVLICGLASGSYPAFFLTRYSIESTLKGGDKEGKRSLRFRKFSIIGQFAISIILLSVISVVYAQMEFGKTKDLGFTKDGLISIPNLNRQFVTTQYESFKATILQSHFVLNSTVTAHYPGYAASNRSVQPLNSDNRMTFNALQGDQDFINTFEFTFVAGNGFENVQSARNVYVINETAVERLGWNSPGEAIGQQFDQNNVGEIIGVVKDFHIFGLNREIAPALIEDLPDNWYNYFVVVRVQPDKVKESLDFIRSSWQTLYPDKPFIYSFFDDHLDEMYEGEAVIGTVVGIFSFLAMALGCLGLFGLSILTTEQRTKEIGIRKVLGSSVSGIVYIFTKEFLKLILIANIVGLPIAVFVLNQFLQSYAYRIDIDLLNLVGIGFLTLAIAFFTICVQTIKSAHVNPVNLLRYE